MGLSKSKETKTIETPETTIPTKFCSICTQRNKAVTPSVWCNNCQYLLCKACENKHTDREHYVIPFDHYQRLPPFVLNTKFYCMEHNTNYIYFCSNHDKPLCKTCAEINHKTCEDVRTIDEIVQNGGELRGYNNTFSEIEAVCRTLKNITDDRRKNLKRLHYTFELMKMDYERAIDQLIYDLQMEKKEDQQISHLQTLKANKISEMESVYNELTNDISGTLNIVQSKENELSDIISQKNDIKTCSSNFQFFILTKQLKQIIHETNKDIENLFKNEQLNEINMECDMNGEVDDIVSGIQSFGEIRVIRKLSTLSTYFNYTVAQTRVQPSVQTQARVQPAVQIQTRVQMHPQQTVDLVEHGWYNGCCTLPSGLMVFSGIDPNADDNNMVCIYQANGSWRSTIKFKKDEQVCDVAVVDQNHVAVSHPYCKAISIINVLKDQSVVRVKTGEEVSGLCCRGRDIVCCVRGKGLIRVNIDSEVVETKREDTSVGMDSNVHVSESHICYTSYKTHTVIVLDTRYNEIFRYKDEAVLNWPMGVTMDDNNIYVTGYLSHNLVVISHDGESCHQLLGKDDGLDSPTAVHYDSSEKKLVVLNNYGPAFLYSVG